MLKGFREFILKGNVIDLATAVIIGTAFTAIVTAFTDGIVQPIINTIPWSPSDAAGLGFNIIPDKPSTFVNLGSVITATINFLIIAAVVYFVIILPYNKLTELGGFGKKAEVTEVALLTEIRDLLDPEGASKAKEEAEKDLPDHLNNPGAPSGGQPVAAPAPTQRLTTPPPQSAAPAPHYQNPPSAPFPAQPGPPPAGNPPYPTPNPAPGSYPPPGNYPPPGSQFPGEYPPDPQGRHSR